MTALTVGVLAIQGGFDKHIQMLRRLDVTAIQVKRTGDLEKCRGLIIPGGESTTMTLLLNKYEMWKPLRDFARNNSVMGTCAGAIMMATKVADPRVRPLELIDITADRNAYGRQTESFITELDTPFTDDSNPLRAVFIRAPKLIPLTRDVKILAELEGEPVVLQQGKHLVMAFHPELTQDTRIHRYFVDTLI